MNLVELMRNVKISEKDLGIELQIARIKNGFSTKELCHILNIPLEKIEEMESGIIFENFDIFQSLITFYEKKLSITLENEKN